MNEKGHAAPHRRKAALSAAARALAHASGMPPDTMHAEILHLSFGERLSVENHRALLKCADTEIVFYAGYSLYHVGGTGLIVEFIGEDTLIVRGNITALTREAGEGH